MLLSQIITAILKAKLTMILVAKHQHVYKLGGLQLGFSLLKPTLAGKIRKFIRLKNGLNASLQFGFTISNKCTLIANKRRFSPKKLTRFLKKSLYL